MAEPSIRHRKGKKLSANPEDGGEGETMALDKRDVHSASPYWMGLVVVTILACLTRFYKISHPSQVVFDEVHFGKFASYYILRTYFFDVHPPFAKLLFAFVGWIAGFDGHFLFDNIGDDYIVNKVPYLVFRALPAMLGALTVPVVFLTMQESGYSLPACLTAACFILFDNAHIGQVRLILLDATLVFSMACSLYTYVKFYKQRHIPFSTLWWKWLLLTGTALSCVISTKYVGAFTFFTIGSAVAIDLWNLMDIRRGLSIELFAKHFAARAFGLIVFPFILYLFWFAVHFQILTKSGPGDDFMTPAFQETLSDNMMTLQAKPIHFGDTITLQHKETKTFLHSHADTYPLRYEDGRISSQGQQVTGYPHDDLNNHWIIEPAESFPNSYATTVTNGALVKLHHVMTNTDLLSHDVASPLYPTNQEFSTVPLDQSYGPRHADTIFEIRIENGKPGQEFKSKSGQFKLVHHNTKIAMWTHTTPLPDWAFNQQEINGNKNILQSSNIWYVQDIIGLTDPARLDDQAPRKTTTLPFFTKYFELQAAMFRHNNALTSEHPYATVPIQWPFLLRGVSFWTEEETRQQIYYLGNPMGWWIASALLAVLSGMLIGDQLTRRRGNYLLDEAFRARLYNSAGFFLLAWAVHYFPFFLMGRQLFLHHYLPAHLASALVTGAMVQLIFDKEPVHGPVSRGVVVMENSSVKKGKGPRLDAFKSGRASWIAATALIGSVVWSFLVFAPLTYGTPGLEVSEVHFRRWVPTWDYHFAK